MSSPTSNRVSVTVNPTFWDLYIATLKVIRYQRVLIVVHALFPLAGLVIFVGSIVERDRFGAEEVVLILVCFSFTPLITAWALWVARRRNKLAQGPFTYTFDSEGIHTSGATFSQTIKWPAILRARQSKRYLFIFISPSRALCIPLQELNHQGVLDQVRDIVRQHADLR